MFTLQYRNISLQTKLIPSDKLLYMSIVITIYNSSDRLRSSLQIRYAVYRVQITNGLSPEISSMLVQELINQLSKNVSAVPRNNFKSPPQSQPLATAMHKAVTPPRPSPPPSNPEESSEEPLYIITPTYRRPEQIPELTRMAHTLMLAKNIHWLVIEDATVATKQVTELLERTGLKFDHLIGK